MVPVLKELRVWKAAILCGVMASRQETGGVGLQHAAKDDPVTWETPDVLRADNGPRRTGDPLRRAVRSERTDGRPRECTTHRIVVRLVSKARRGKTGAVG